MTGTVVGGLWSPGTVDSGGGGAVVGVCSTSVVATTSAPGWSRTAFSAARLVSGLTTPNHSPTSAPASTTSPATRDPSRSGTTGDWTKVALATAVGKPC